MAQSLLVCYPSTIRIFDLITLELDSELPPCDIAFIHPVHHEEKSLLVVIDKRRLALYNCDSQTYSSQYTKNISASCCIDANRIAVCGTDGELLIFEILPKLQKTAAYRTTLLQCTVLISASENVFVGLLQGNKPVVYNVREGTTKRLSVAKTMCLVGTTLALGLPLGNIDLICVRTWNKIGFIETLPVSGLCTINSDTIASHASDDIMIWNVRTGECISVLEGCSWVRSLTLVYSDLLVSLRSDNEVDLWSTETWHWLGTFGEEYRNAQVSAVCGMK